jgi:hypothetical protein
MENSETSCAFTTRRHPPHGILTVYQNPYERGLTHSIPTTSITGSTTMPSPMIDGALSCNSQNPTMSISDSALNAQQMTDMSSEHRNYSSYWGHPYQESSHLDETLLNAFKDVSSSQASQVSGSTGSWDFDAYSKQALEDNPNTPSLTESPTTTPGCPRSAMMPDFSIWEALPKGPFDTDSAFNSPAPSYVLDSKSGSHSSHLRS